MSGAWVCKEHGSTQGDDKTYCSACMAVFRERKPVADMTIEERISAMQRLMSHLTIPFTDVHEWITELMGRDVWTHELAYPDQLYDELRNGEQVGIADVIAKLPWDKPVILVSEQDVVELP